MSPLSWLLVAAALALVTRGSHAASRMRGLATRGRLDSAAERARSRWIRHLPLVAVARLTSVGVACLAWLFIGPAVAVAVGALALAATSLLSRVRVDRAALKAKRQLCDAVHYLIVAELEAGSAPAAALDAAAKSMVGTPHAPILSEAAGLATRGEPVSGVFANAPNPLGMLGRAWVVADSAGIAPAGVLARVASDLDAGLAQQRAVSAVLAGPRSSAFMLAGLPALGLVLGNAVGTAPLAFLAGGRIGQLVFCAGVLLDIAGALWTQRMIQRAGRT